MISNITGDNQWENCISLDFYFRGLSGQRNQQKNTINNVFHSAKVKMDWT